MKCIVTVLALLSAAGTQSVSAQHAGGALDGTQQLGRRLLAQSCGVCHLQVQLNAKTYGPQLNKTSAGGNDEVMRVFIMNGSDHMPAFKYYLKPAEVDAIIAYVRTVPAPPAAQATR